VQLKIIKNPDTVQLEKNEDILQLKIMRNQVPVYLNILGNQDTAHVNLLKSRDTGQLNNKNWYAMQAEKTP
jgi:hypothetical protein